MFHMCPPFFWWFVFPFSAPTSRQAFMKKQFGNSFRAWRQALDLDGSMNLQRAELFKASPDRGDVEVGRRLSSGPDRRNTRSGRLPAQDARRIVMRKVTSKKDLKKKCKWSHLLVRMLNSNYQPLIRIHGLYHPFMANLWMVYCVDVTLW